MLSLLVVAASLHKGLCKVAEVAAVRVVLVPLEVLVDLARVDEGDKKDGNELSVCMLERLRQVAVAKVVSIGLVDKAKDAAVGHDDIWYLPPIRPSPPGCGYAYHAWRRLTAPSLSSSTHRGPFLITEMGQCMLLKGVIALTELRMK